MSVQQGDQMQQLVYPVTETNPPSHRQPNGSFGAVFIVLGVIVAVSVIACFLGRLCSRRYNKSKPSNRGRYTREKNMKSKRNVYQTKDGDLEYGFDKRFSSAKVATNGEPGMSPNMGRVNSFHEPNMGPNPGRTNLFHEPNMGPNLARPNMFHEPNMGPDLGRPHSFHESNMGPDLGRPNSFHETNMGPNVGRPNSFHETNMGPNMGRPHSFHEPNMGRPNSRESNMGSNMGRPNSFREPSMGGPESSREPSMGRPNSFRKGEYRDDQMRFGGNEDDHINFKSSTGPQYY